MENSIMISKDNEYIDIWTIIKKTLLEFDLIDQYIFIAIFAYDHSFRGLSKIINRNPKYIKAVLNKIKRRIRKRFKEHGLNSNRVSNLFGSSTILEISNEDESNEDEI